MDDVGSVGIEPTNVQHASVVRIHHVKAVCRHAADNQLRKNAGFLKKKIGKKTGEKTNTFLKHFKICIYLSLSFLPVCSS